MPLSLTPTATLATQDEHENIQSSGLDIQDVVVALVNKGISMAVARRLASTYNHDLIVEKIEFLEYILKTTTPNTVKNPAGWLRRAIEEDFAKPAGFVSREEQEAKEKDHQEALKELQRKLNAQMALEEAERMNRTKWLEDQLASLKCQYNTSEGEENLWSDIVMQLRETSGGLKMFLVGTQLLSIEGKTAVIWVPTEFAKERIVREFYLPIKRLLARHLNISSHDVDAITLTFIVPEQPNDP